MNKIEQNPRITGSSPLITFPGILLIISFGLVLASCAGAVVAEAPVTTSQIISPLDFTDTFGDSSSYLLIDVRTPEEFESVHIPDAINIPVDELAQRLDEVPGESPIVVYCRSGNRSAIASDILSQAGYSPVFDLGGIQDWVAQGLPVQ